MNINKISIQEVREIAMDLSEIHVDCWLGILFGGDRILHCDEGMVAKGEDGAPIGLASIAPKGESGLGEPEIVGVYVVQAERRKGVGLSLLKAAVSRCRERGLEPSMVAAGTAGRFLIAKFYSGK